MGVGASARRVHQLSGLRVTARIIDPKGLAHWLLLNDDQVHEPQSGSYQASFMPKNKGRHKGLICIENLGKATVASPLRHASHSEGDIDLKAETPRFVREVPLDLCRR